MIIKVINPQPIKKTGSKKKISNIKKNIKSNPKGNNIMTKRKTVTRRKRNPSIPVFVNRSRRNSVRRRKNPATVGAFSVEGVTDTLMQGVMAAAGAVGVQFIVGKFFNFENQWVKYAALTGIGLGAGYIAGTFNKNLGKNIAIGTVTLVAAQIIQDQFLNSAKMKTLKGDYYEEDQALGNLTLGEIASINEIRDSNLLGASASSSGYGGRLAINSNSALSDAADYSDVTNPYLSYP